MRRHRIARRIWHFAPFASADGCYSAIRPATGGIRLSSIYPPRPNDKRKVEADDLPITRAVPILDQDESCLGIARSIGNGVAKLAQAFSEMSPDLVMLLGDRYEILAAAQAAFILGIPIAHMYGGEVTEGAWDESICHAITKSSRIYISVSAAPYAQRILQMGEDLRCVHTVGAVAVDTARTLPLPSLADLAQDLGRPLRDPCLLVTYHPVTLRTGEERTVVTALLDALDSVRGARIVITGANADTGSEAIMTQFKGYAQVRADRVTLHSSLGQRRYLGVMRHSAVVIGNSSSALIEAPALGVPSVNIGARQRGRLKAASVIDCGESYNVIVAALAKALSPEFRASIADKPLPYEGGGVVERIIDILCNSDFASLQTKTFHDRLVSI